MRLQSRASLTFEPSSLACTNLLSHTVTKIVHSLSCDGRRSSWSPITTLRSTGPLSPASTILLSTGLSRGSLFVVRAIQHHVTQSMCRLGGFRRLRWSLQPRRLLRSARWMTRRLLARPRSLIIREFLPLVSHTPRPSEAARGNLHRQKVHTLDPQKMGRLHLRLGQSRRR
jgi:hypothetical protein